MTAPGRQQVEPGAAGFYHGIAECVRRAFLCGYDRHTEASYDHRKRWIEPASSASPLSSPSTVAAYAAMSKHLPVVLYQDPDRTAAWSAKEVVHRWLDLHPSRNSHGQVMECSDTCLRNRAARKRKSPSGGDSSRTCACSWLTPPSGRRSRAKPEQVLAEVLTPLWNQERMLSTTSWSIHPAKRSARLAPDLPA